MKVRSDSEAAVDLILKLFRYIDKADGETDEDEQFCNDFFENQMRNWEKFNVQPYYFKEAIANHDEWIFNCFFQDVKSCWEVLEGRINTLLIWSLSLFDCDYNNIDDNAFENIKHACFATTNLASLNVNEFQDKNAFCEKIGKLYDKLDIYLQAIKICQSSRTLKKKVVKTWPMWNFCKHCWRIVPGSSNNNINHGNCSIHQDLNSSAVKKSYKLEKMSLPIPHLNSEFPENHILLFSRKGKFKKNKKILMLDKEFDNCYKQHQCKNLYGMYKRELNDALKNIKVSNNNFMMLLDNYDLYNLMVYDPNKIHCNPVDMQSVLQNLPHVQKYLEQKGLSVDVKDLVSVFRCLDDNDPSTERDNLHTAFSRDPGLAKLFLIEAEVWLRLDALERKTHKKKGRPKKSQAAAN